MNITLKQDIEGPHECHTGHLSDPAVEAPTPWEDVKLNAQRRAAQKLQRAWRQALKRLEETKIRKYKETGDGSVLVSC